MPRARRADPPGAMCSSEQHVAEKAGYDACMAIQRDQVEEQQARLDRMIDEFRAARQRRLDKQEIARANRDDKRHRQPPAHDEPPAQMN